MHDCAIMWFRRDLRLADNPALTRALDHARGVVPVAVEPAAYGPGAAAAGWRARSLIALDESLVSRGSSLHVLDGPAHEVLPHVARELGATLVTFTRAWDPASRAEESRVVTALAAASIECSVAESAHLGTPGSLLTHAGAPYRVFTPFHRAWERAVRAEAPLAAPTRIPSPPRVPGGARRPAAHGDHEPHPRWRPGEAGAAGRLEGFAAGAIAAYGVERDRPARAGTSELSAHLAAGEVSPRQVAYAVWISAQRQDQPPGDPAAGADAFLRQLAWRDFAAQVLDAWPELATRPLRADFGAFPWREDPEAFARWCAGTTGFPLVDAGMRQLASTGWMHNRVRLVAASVLVKDLLVPWQTGERYFRDTLVDYDPAQNAFNWQWVAGSGADAAPYFRIFNPVVQGQRFDPDGSYVRTWVPELARIPTRWIHAPLDAPEDIRGAAGLSRLGTYPPPIVEHALARRRALGAYDSLRDTSL